MTNLEILMRAIKLSLFLGTFQCHTVSTQASSKPFWDVYDSWIRDVVDLEPYVCMYVT